MIKIKNADSKYTVKYKIEDGSVFVYVNKRYFGRCHIATLAVMEDKGFEKCLGLIGD